MTSVVCAGDLMVDVLAQLPGPLAPGSDTPARIALFGGGAAANVAAWVCAARGRATFVGRVGTDELGRAAVEELTTAGVEASIAVDASRPTGSCIVLVDPSGERTMVPSAGANDGPLDVAALPLVADWLYVSGYALLKDGPRPGALAMLQTARERGWRVAVDAASAAPLRAAGAQRFLGWLPDEGVLFANADEAQVLTGELDPVAAARLLAARCGAAVVKRGPGGAVWSDGTAVVVAPALPCDVVDSTGAGDAFAAGFLIANGTADERLASAARLAAEAVTRLGARPAAPQ